MLSFYATKKCGHLTLSNKSAQKAVTIIRNCVSILGKRCCCWVFHCTASHKPNCSEFNICNCPNLSLKLPGRTAVQGVEIANIVFVRVNYPSQFRDWNKSWKGCIFLWCNLRNCGLHGWWEHRNTATLWPTLLPRYCPYCPTFTDLWQR